MTLIGFLTLIGWVFTIIPLLAFFAISITMIVGAAKDDSLIMALTLLGVTIFALGSITLVLIYLTNLL